MKKSTIYFLDGGTRVSSPQSEQNLISPQGALQWGQCFDTFWAEFDGLWLWFSGGAAFWLLVEKQ